MFQTVSCTECGHDVDARLKRCPVCGVGLEGDVSTQGPYPSYQAIVRRQKLRLARRLVNFAFPVAMIIIAAINLLDTSHGWWMWTVLLGLAYVWLTLGHTVLAEGRLAVRLVVAVYALCAALIAVDFIWGWAGWSLTYAVPSVLGGALVGAGVATAIWLRKDPRSGVFGFVVGISVAAVATLLSWFAGLLNVLWPAQSAAFAGLALTAALAVFFRKEFGQYVRSELHF